MNETLYAILSAHAETFHIAIDGNPETAILYAQYDQQDEAFESDNPLSERFFFRVAILQQERDETLIDAVKADLRANGWRISGPTDFFNGERQRYQHEFNLTKWRMKPC